MNTALPNRAASLFLVAACLASVPALADCYAVYGSAYRSFYYKASGIQLPSRAGNFSSLGECRAFLDQMFSDPTYRYDTGLHSTQCECSGGQAGYQGGGYSGGSLQQQIVSMAVSSLLNALFAGLDAPSGPSGDEIRAKLQKQWDDDEASRALAEKKRQEALFVQAQQAATALMGQRPSSVAAAQPVVLNRDDGVYLGSGAMPGLLRSSGAVSEAEWAEARRWQARIDALWLQQPLSAAAAKELAQLEARRNALWKRAIAVPGLTQRERDALRLKLHVSGEGGVAASSDDLIGARDQAPTVKPKAGPLGVLGGAVEASLTGGLMSAAENWGDDAADSLTVRGGKAVLKFGDAYFLGQLAVAAYQGKPEEIGAPVANWTLGKIVTKAPAYGLAVGLVQGARDVTTGVVKREVQYLVEETDKLIPGFMPRADFAAWWNESAPDLTPSQKIGFNAWGW